ncbi:MAG TPA: AAA family ATPase [Candidatus Limnocylindrales bacterium]|nr:AAA family ATPase [Candidatus Limnocylindrales bacterium]
MPTVQVPPGVEGIVRLTELPDDNWRDRWTRIIVPAATKDRLLNFVLFALSHRAKTSDVGLGLHGLVILAGPPGTGKTTLAGGLADEAARVLDGGPLLFVDIDPHAFPSQLLGESQRAVSRLFERTIPDLARRGHPLVVLIDEVEALAVNRSSASLETNPVDVHRATDALLSGVDQVSRTWPNVLFLATTNFRVGVDTAFLSRADLIEEIGLPGVDAVAAILADTLAEVGAPVTSATAAPVAAGGASGDVGADHGGAPASAGARWPEELVRLAARCVEAELDARQVRKLVVRTASSSRALALDPSSMTIADVGAELARGA